MTQKLSNPVSVCRTFKTIWFAKEARKAKITDTALCRAISQVMQGQADDLGGGVIAPDELAGFKKLAKDYSSASDAHLEKLLNDKELLEICHDH